MSIVKLHQLSTMLCGFLKNLSKSIILSLSKSYIWGSTETIELVCLMDLALKYFIVDLKEKLKIKIVFPHLLL